MDRRHDCFLQEVGGIEDGTAEGTLMVWEDWGKVTPHGEHPEVSELARALDSGRSREKGSY